MIRVDLQHNALVRARFATDCLLLQERISALLLKNEQLSLALLGLASARQDAFNQLSDRPAQCSPTPAQ